MSDILAEVRGRGSIFYGIHKFLSRILIFEIQVPPVLSYSFLAVIVMFIAVPIISFLLWGEVHQIWDFMSLLIKSGKIIFTDSHFWSTFELL